MKRWRLATNLEVFAEKTKLRGVFEDLFLVDLAALHRILPHPSASPLIKV
jgi:hypothetical protein